MITQLSTEHPAVTSVPIELPLREGWILYGRSFRRSANYQAWMAWANQPGIWLQRITTLEPSDDMVEVAVASLLAALTDDEVAAVEERGPIVAAALAAEREEDADG